MSSVNLFISLIVVCKSWLELFVPSIDIEDFTLISCNFLSCLLSSSLFSCLFLYIFEKTESLYLKNFLLIYFLIHLVLTIFLLNHLLHLLQLLVRLNSILYILLLLNVHFRLFFLFYLIYLLIKVILPKLRTKKVTLNGNAVREPEFSLENGVYEIRVELNWSAVQCLRKNCEPAVCRLFPRIVRLVWPVRMVRQTRDSPIRTSCRQSRRQFFLPEIPKSDRLCWK